MAAGAEQLGAPGGVAAPAPLPGALLLGADYRALGVARSLGRRGVAVELLREPGEPLAAASRFVRRQRAWPAAEPEARVRALLDLAAREGRRGWAVIPTSDEAAALVARHHERLAEAFVLTTPPWATTRWAYDKRRTAELAERLAVPAPATIVPGGPRLPEPLAIRYPAIIKPAVKADFNALTAAKAWRVDDQRALRTRWAEACTLLDPELLMIQEMVPGGTGSQLSFAALCSDGVPLATLTAERTRQYPADFGRASTLVETRAIPEIADASRRILRELGWTGLIEIEFKRDDRDGVPKLLDLNPRVWGWQSLCGRAGVDFPWLLWLMLEGRRTPPVEAREGVRWMRLSTDAPVALGEIARGRLAPGAYVRSLRGPRERAIFAWDDPAPGLAEAPVLAYLAGRRLIAGKGL